MSADADDPRQPADQGIDDALLEENRQFAPPSEFVQRARVASADVYAAAEADPQAFWAGFAEELRWIKPWDRVVEGQGPRGPLVRGRAAQRLRQLRGPPHRGRQAQQGGVDLGGRAGRTAHLDLFRPVPRGQPAGQRVARASAWARAIASRSTCRWCPRRCCRCWPARGSERFTAWCSAVFRRSRCAIGSTMPRRSC